MKGRANTIREAVYTWSWQKQYDVLTALRGPDVGGNLAERLKSVYTLGFRRIVFKGSHQGHVVNASRVSMLAEAWKMQGAKEPAMLHHFRNHLIEAMSHVALHPVWKGEGKALYLALRSGLRGPGVGERAAAVKAIAHRLEVKANAKSGTKAR